MNTWVLLSCQELFPQTSFIDCGRELRDTVPRSWAAHAPILHLIKYHVISYITSVSVLAAGAKAFNWSNKQARQGGVLRP